MKDRKQIGYQMNEEDIEKKKEDLRRQLKTVIKKNEKKQIDEKMQRYKLEKPTIQQIKDYNELIKNLKKKI